MYHEGTERRILVVILRKAGGAWRDYHAVAEVDEHHFLASFTAYACPLWDV